MRHEINNRKPVIRRINRRSYRANFITKRIKWRIKKYTATRHLFLVHQHFGSTIVRHRSDSNPSFGSLGNP